MNENVVATPQLDHWQRGIIGKIQQKLDKQLSGDQFDLIASLSESQRNNLKRFLKVVEQEQLECINDDSILVLNLVPQQQQQTNAKSAGSSIDKVLTVVLIKSSDQSDLEQSRWSEILRDRNDGYKLIGRLKDCLALADTTTRSSASSEDETKMTCVLNILQLIDCIQDYELKHGIDLVNLLNDTERSNFLNNVIDWADQLYDILYETEEQNDNNAISAASQPDIDTKTSINRHNSSYLIRINIIHSNQERLIALQQAISWVFKEDRTRRYAAHLIKPNDDNAKADNTYRILEIAKEKINQLQATINEHHLHKIEVLKSWIKQFVATLDFQPSNCCIRCTAKPSNDKQSRALSVEVTFDKKLFMFVNDYALLTRLNLTNDIDNNVIDLVQTISPCLGLASTLHKIMDDRQNLDEKIDEPTLKPILRDAAERLTATIGLSQSKNLTWLDYDGFLENDSSKIQVKPKETSVQNAKAEDLVDWIKCLDKAMITCRQLANFLIGINEKMKSLFEVLRVNRILDESMKVAAPWKSTLESIHGLVEINIEENFEIPSIRQHSGLWKKNWRAQLDSIIINQIENIGPIFIPSLTGVDSADSNRIKFILFTSGDSCTITVTPNEDLIRSHFKSAILSTVDDIIRLRNIIGMDSNADDQMINLDEISSKMMHNTSFVCEEIAKISSILEKCASLQLEAMNIIIDAPSHEDIEARKRRLESLSKLFNGEIVNDNDKHNRVLLAIQTRLLESRRFQDISKCLQSNPNILLDIQNVSDFLENSYEELIHFVLDDLEYSMHCDYKRLQAYLTMSTQILRHPLTAIDLFRLETFINGFTINSISDLIQHIDNLPTKQIVKSIKFSIEEKTQSIDRWKKAYKGLINVKESSFVTDDETKNLIEIDFRQFIAMLSDMEGKLDRIKLSFKDKLSAECDDLFVDLDKFLQDFEGYEDVDLNYIENISDRSELLHKRLMIVRTEYEYFRIPAPGMLLLYDKGLDTQNNYDSPSTLWRFFLARKQLKTQSYQTDLIRNLNEGLQKYLDMNWISEGRKNVAEAIRYINEYKDRYIMTNNDSLISSQVNTLLDPLKKTIDQWIVNIELLQECQGNNFQDIHWSQLLEIIKMSKKVNYRTMTMRNLMESINEIKTNSHLINRLNSQVNLESDINNSMGKLKHLVHESRLAVIDFKSHDIEGDYEFRIIKDFKKVFEQISHCRSVLKSLKLAAGAGTNDNSTSNEVSADVIDELKKLSIICQDLEAYLVLTNRIQSKLLTLLPIFKKQLSQKNTRRPNSYKLFSATKQKYNTIEESGYKYTQALLLFSGLMDSLIGFSDSTKRSSLIKLHASTDSTTNFSITKLLNTSSLKLKLLSIESLLDQIQKELHILLERVRENFPRFYFLSDEELVYILSDDRDFILVQNNSRKSQLIKKIFNNSIDKFLIAENDNEGPKSVIGVRSPYGEIIEFRDRIMLDEKSERTTDMLDERFRVCHLLDLIRNQISLSLQKLLEVGLKVYNLQHQPPLFILPCQVISLSSWITFSAQIEQAIASCTLDCLEQDYHNSLILLLQMDQPSANIGSIVQFEYKKHSLTLDIVHFITVCKALRENQVKDVEDWEWQKQLRYYCRSDKESTNITVYVKMLDASFEYNFDLMPLNVQQSSTANTKSRLQCRKLIENAATHRCFLVSTQAVSQFKMGTNPYGPAGSGKTESIKALGACLGRHVMVFNCDETADFFSLSRIIIGMVKSGYWCCLDEFNRLSKDVMSSLSTTLEEIQRCIKDNNPYLSADCLISKSHEVAINELERNKHKNSMIPDEPSASMIDRPKRSLIDLNSAFFITLNPIGERYLGRNRLPSNLKSLFMPISMMQTSPGPIVSKTLMSKGLDVVRANKISEKLLFWFEKVQNMVSHQIHYDWSQRTLMVIIRQLKIDDSIDINNENLTQIELQLLKVIKQTIKPKLVGSDISEFNRSLFDVFGELADIKHNNFDTGYEDSSFELDRRKLIKLACLKLNLVDNLEQTEKVEQLYQQMKTHIGLLVVGPTGSGKSTTWKILQMALNMAISGSYDDQKLALSSIGLREVVLAKTINPKSLTSKELFGYIDPTTQLWVEGLFASTVRNAVNCVHETSSCSEETVVGNSVWLVLDGPIDPEWIESLNSILDDNQVLTLASGERIDLSPNNSESANYKTHMQGFSFQPNVRLIFEAIDLKYASPASISRLGIIYHEVDTVRLALSRDGGIEEITTVKIGQTLKQIENIFEENSVGNELASKSTEFDPLSITNAMKMIACRQTTLHQLIEHRGYDQEARYPTIEQDRFSLIEPPNYLGRHISLCKILTEEDEPILLTGKSIQVDKEMIIEQILYDLDPRDFYLIKIDCSRGTNSNSLLNLLSSVVNDAGVSKVERKLIIFANNIDLIDYDDKWMTRSFLELLLFMMTYKGYHKVVNTAVKSDGSHEVNENISWISTPKLQIICTTESLNLSPRLLCRFNLVHLKNPESSEIDFTKYLIGMMDRLSEINHSKVSNAIERSIKEINIDLLDRSKFAENFLSDIRQLSNISEINDVDIMGIMANIIGRGFPTPCQTFMWCNTEQESPNMVHVSREKFTEFCKEATELWLKHDESVLRIRDIVWTDQLLRIYSIVQCFLNNMDSFSTNRNSFCEVLTLTSKCHGTGRSMAVRSVAMKLGYSEVWTTRDYHSITELRRKIRDVTRDMHQLIKVNTPAAGGHPSSKKILIVLNHIQMSLDAKLSEHIYAMISLVQSNLFRYIDIKVIYLSETLDYNDLRLWSTVGRVVNMDTLLTKNDLELIIDHTIDRTTSNMLSSYHRKEYGNKRVPPPKIGGILKKFIDTKWLEYTFPSLYRNDLRRFLSFSYDFSHNYLTHHERLMRRSENLFRGAEKLRQFQKSVSLIEGSANEKEKSISLKENEANKLVAAITRSVKKAETEHDQLKMAKREHEERNNETSKQAKELTMQLDIIRPKVEQAKSNIKQYLRADALSEIRALRAPPNTIRDILEATLRLMGINDTSWTSMKQFLARKSLKDELTSFDCERNLDSAMIKQVEQLIQDRRESFQESQAKRASQAVLPLLQWVLATLDYGKVIIELKPMRDELEKLESGLRESDQQKSILINKIDTIKSNVDSLNSQLDAVMHETTQLKLDLSLLRRILNSAQEISNKLTEQSSRWNVQVNKLEVYLQDDLFEMTCLLLTALSNYCGDFSERNLKELMEKFGNTMEINKLGIDDLVKHFREFFDIDYNEKLSTHIIRSSTSNFLKLLFDEPNAMNLWLNKELNSRPGSKYVSISACRSEWFNEVAINSRFCDVVVVEDFFFNPNHQSFAGNQTLNIIPMLRNELHSQWSAEVGEMAGDSASLRNWYILGDQKVFIKKSLQLVFIRDDKSSPISDDIVHLFKIIRSFANDDASQDEEILNILVKELNPELAFKKLDLEKKLEACQKDLVKYDEKLLDLLIKSDDIVVRSEGKASSASEETIPSERAEDLFNVDLLDGLRTLKESSEAIKKTVSESKLTSEKLMQERKKYELDGVKITKILEVVYNLTKLDPLYRFSSTECLKVLKGFLLSYKESDRDSSRTIAEDFIPCLHSYVGSSLSPFHRIAFMNILKFYLKDGNTMGDIDTIDILSKPCPNLSDVIRLLLGSDSDPWESPYKVLVVIHESRTTPMFEIEETMKQMSDRQYHKIFASSTAIDKINYLVDINKSPQLSCLCLINVHMIMNWTKLLFDTITRIGNVSTKDKKLVILVAETAEGMDVRLLGVARKFYYDESSRDILTRFNSLAKIISVDPLRAKDSLVGQLILFHSACQERTKYLPYGWTREYDFDYDQFRQSLSVFRRLYTGAESRDKVESLRKMLSKFLYSVVYGARLDCPQDDTILISQIDKFIGRQLGPQQLDALKQIESMRSGIDSKLLRMIDITEDVSDELNNKVKSKIKGVMAEILKIENRYKLKT